MTHFKGKVIFITGAGKRIGCDRQPHCTETGIGAEEAAFVVRMQGLEGFTRQAAQELNPFGIQVHGVKVGDDIVERVVYLFEEER